MKITKQTLYDLGIIFLMTIPAWFALLQPGYFPMHDDQHIARLFLLDQGIHQGILFPRWVDSLGFNFGYPLFLFYPPLLYYLAETFHIFGVSLVWSIKLVLVCGYIIGAIGMYLSARELWNRFSGFIAATFYTYFFYHTVLVYVRGAFAEFLLMSLFPVVLFTFTRFGKSQSIWTAFVNGVLIALLVLAHHITAMPAVGFLLIYASWIILAAPKNDRKKLFIGYSISVGLGLGLSAFFWLPALTQKGLTLVDTVALKNAKVYLDNFVYPAQFLQSNWGYGASVAGPEDGITFQLGKLHIFFGSLAFFGLFFRRLSSKVKNVKVNAAELMGIFALICLWLMTPVSQFVWDAIPLLQYLQFPWRFMTFTGVFGSLLIAYLGFTGFNIIKALENKVFTFTGAFGLVALLMVVVFQYSQYFVPKNIRNVSDSELTTLSELSWRVSQSSYEFLPKTVSTQVNQYGVAFPLVNEADIHHPPYTLLSGKALVDISDQSFNSKSFIINTAQDLVFQLNTVNFPGWIAELQNPLTGEVTKLTITNSGPMSLQSVSVPPGEYILTFNFTDLLPTFFGQLISGLLLLIMCAAVWKAKKTESIYKNLIDLKV